MNLLNVGKFEEKEFKFVVNIDFTTKTELTPRMIDISEAFGLGISEEKYFIIYKDFRLGFNKGDVVFITGDSGGGKSLLLNHIRTFIECTSVNLDDIVPDPEEVIIENIGETVEEGVRYLSMMGLNDCLS